MNFRWVLVPLAPLIVLILLRAAHHYNPLAPLFYLPATILALRSAYKFARYRSANTRYLWVTLAFGLHPVFGLLLLFHSLWKVDRGWVRFKGIFPKKALVAFRLLGNVAKAKFVRVANGEAYVLVESMWFTSSGAYRRALRKAREILKWALERDIIPIPVRARELPRGWDDSDPLGLPRTEDVPAIFAIGSELRRVELKLPKGFVGVLVDGRFWALPSWQARAMLEVGLCKGDPDEFQEEPPPDPSGYGIELGPARPLGLYKPLRLEPLDHAPKPSNVAGIRLNRTLPFA